MPIPASSGNQKQIAVFDINMGCPAPKITGNGDGSALMRSPVLAARIIEAAVRAVSIPVSVKFRLGWDADSINARLNLQRWPSPPVLLLSPFTAEPECRCIPELRIGIRLRRL